MARSRTVGQRVREKREARGWTQVKLAEESGVDNTVISRIEGGRRTRITPEVIARLERALGLRQGGLWMAIYEAAGDGRA